MLNAVEVVKELFKGEHIANILAGKESSAIKSYKHNKLEIFGSGKNKDYKFWNSVFRQALIHHLLIKDIENYGLLKFTEKGRKFQKNPHSLMMSQDHNYDTAYEDFINSGSSNGSGAADEELFMLLKSLRKTISNRKKIPPFVIFQDPSFEDMAIQYPVTLEELQKIQGVGVGKAQKYGKEFVELIKKYVEEKDIERPQDLVVKSIVNKSQLKVFIIKNIDRKLNFEDIANSKGLDMNELLTEIEVIVNSGTKVNISYYVNQVMEEEQQQDIYSYFIEAETESIDAAMEEFSDEDYTEEDIRLMRIKFMAELGH